MEPLLDCITTGEIVQIIKSAKGEGDCQPLFVQRVVKSLFIFFGRWWLESWQVPVAQWKCYQIAVILSFPSSKEALLLHWL